MMSMDRLRLPLVQCSPLKSQWLLQFEITLKMHCVCYNIQLEWLLAFHVTLSQSKTIESLASVSDYVVNCLVSTPPSNELDN